MRAVAGGIGVAAVVVVLGGCGSGDPAPEGSAPTRSEVSAEQEAALADGEVTYDEYLAGFRRFSSCMEEEGFKVTYLGEMERLLNYSLEERAVTSGADVRCYAREFDQVDSAWQSLSIEWQTDTPTARDIRECAVEHGIEPKKTLAQMHEQLEEAGVTMDDCFLK